MLVVVIDTHDTSIEEDIDSKNSIKLKWISVKSKFNIIIVPNKSIEQDK